MKPSFLVIVVVVSSVLWLPCTGSLAQGPASPPASRNAESLVPFEQGGKWGYVDPAGKFVIAPQFDSADPFSEGMAEVELNGRLGWIGTDGHFVIQPKYFKAGPFKEGLAWVVTRKPWTPLGTGEYGFALFGKVTYIDRSGKEIRRPFSVERFSDFSEGLAAVRPGTTYGGCTGKVGYLNAKGEWAITPQFDEGRDFSDGLAAVNKGGSCGIDGKWGYIKKDGELTIPFPYDFASQFKNGHACVRRDGQWKRIDKNGDETPVRQDEC